MNPKYERKKSIKNVKNHVVNPHPKLFKIKSSKPSGKT